MNGSPVNGRGPGGCAPLVWIVLVTLLVAGVIWLTKSLFPGVLTAMILGTRFS